MQYKIKKNIILLISLTMMILHACSKENNFIAPSSSSIKGIPATTAPARSPSGKLTTKILPEKPTAASDLQALYTYTGNGQVIFQWEQNGRPLEQKNGPTLFSNKRFARGDQIAVTVTADGESVADMVVIRNTPPVVTSVIFQPEFIFRGVDITVAAVGFDADGDDLQFSYKWTINGEDITNNAPILKGDRFHRGDRVGITVIPYDSEGEGPPFIGKPVVIPNAPPRFVSVPPDNFHAETFFYQAAAEDPDGDPLFYALASAPKGMTIDLKTGLITLKISKEHEGTHQIEVVAQDPSGSKISQQYALTISIPRGENEKK